MSDLSLILLILAGLTGAYQLALLGSVVARGAAVTMWWGFACAAFLIAWVVFAR